MNKPKSILKLNALPQIKNSSEIIEGIFEKPFVFCTRHFNSKCIEHYKKANISEGFYICPYGFTTYHTKINNKKTIYTSIEVEGKRNRKLTKKYKTKKDIKKVHTLKDFYKLNKWESESNSIYTAKSNILRDFDKETSIVEQKREILDDVLHELRKLNNMIKKQAFSMLKGFENKNPIIDFIELKAKNIYATSQTISVRLNAYDFTLNPEIVELNPLKKIGIYRKFEKAKYNVQILTQDLDISIRFKGKSHTKKLCYDIIEILPYILFDNAIKFNHEKNDITCEFIKKKGELSEIIVSNYAILPDKKELSRLTEKHFRSENVIEKGTGKGLHLASMICEQHDFDLIFDSVEKEIINGKPFGIFQVKIRL